MSNRTAYLIITDRCNQSCDYCWYRIGYHEYVNESFTIDDAKRLLSDLKNARFREISFTGGEPCLRDDIYDCIAFAHSLSLITTLCTNGTLLTTDAIHQFKEAGLNNVYISLDSLNENIHNKNRENFGRVFDALKNLIKADFDVIGVNTTLTRYNIDSIEEMLSFCIEQQITLNITPAWFTDGHPLEAEFSLSDLQKQQYIINTKQWIDTYGIDYYSLAKIYFEDWDRKAIPDFCQVASQDIVIHPDGKMFVCFFNNEGFLGNYFEQPFSKLFNNRDTIISKLDVKKCCSNHCLNLLCE